MNRVTRWLGLSALLVLATCATDDDESMVGRTAEVARCADVLTLECGEHFGDIMSADSMGAIQSIEWMHYRAMHDDLDDLDYWIGQLRACERNGEPPPWQDLDAISQIARMELATHRLMMAFASNRGDAVAEEERYQASMMSYFGELHGHHHQMEHMAGDYRCPLE